MKTIYTCGPTVYAAPHIGNLRTFAHADSIRKEIEKGGELVKHVINITDIDDKILDLIGITGVFDFEKHLPLIKEFTEPFIQKFKSDLLEIDVDISKITFVNVSDHLIEMKLFVDELLEKGMAYYNEEKKAIVLKNDDGENSDFAIWKTDKNRPGWHLECTVLSRLTLGKNFDIHTGGCDLKFPHHHNENLQSLAYDGTELAKTWIHTEHLFVDGQKMSKSLNNQYNLDDIKAKGYTGKDLRNLYERYSYLNPLDFTWDKLEDAKTPKFDLVNLIEDINSYRNILRSQRSYTISDDIRKILIDNNIQIQDK